MTAVSSGYCDVALVLHPYAITKISTVESGWCSSRLMLSFWLHQSGWGWEPISRQLCGLKQCRIINFNGYKHTIKGQMRRHTVHWVHTGQGLEERITNRSPHLDVVFAKKMSTPPLWKLRLIFPSSRSFFSLWFGFTEVALWVSCYSKLPNVRFKRGTFKGGSRAEQISFSLVHLSSMKPFWACSWVLL